MLIYRRVIKANKLTSHQVKRGPLCHAICLFFKKMLLEFDKACICLASGLVQSTTPKLSGDKKWPRSPIKWSFVWKNLMNKTAMFAETNASLWWHGGVLILAERPVSAEQGRNGRGPGSLVPSKLLRPNLFAQLSAFCDIAVKYLPSVLSCLHAEWKDLNNGAISGHFAHNPQVIVAQMKAKYYCADAQVNIIFAVFVHGHKCHGLTWCVTSHCHPPYTPLYTPRFSWQWEVGTWGYVILAKSKHKVHD